MVESSLFVKKVDIHKWKSTSYSTFLRILLIYLGKVGVKTARILHLDELILTIAHPQLFHIGELSQAFP